MKALLVRLLVVLTIVASSSVALTAGTAVAAPRYRASLTLSDASPQIGQTVTMSGKVTPKAPGKRVLVQGRVGNGNWATLTRLTLNRSSRYRLTFRVSRAGAIALRVVKPRSRGIPRGISAVRNLVVDGQQATPIITTTSLPAALISTPYSATIMTADQRPGTFGVIDGALPAGLTLDAQTGEIKGTPTAQGTTTFEVQFRDAAGRTDNQTLSIDVVRNGLPAIATTELPNGQVAVAYSQTLKTVDSRVGMWTIVAGTGALPAGLTLNSSTGAITGTPTAAVTTSFLVRFNETATGFTDEQPLSIRIAAANGPLITTTSLPPAIVGRPYSATLMTSVAEPGTWSSTALPPGLTLNATTGLISGTPTVPNSPIPPNFTVTFTRSGLLGPGPADTQTLSIKINPVDPPIIAAATLPEGRVGAPYKTLLRTVGDVSGSWALSSGALPSGLSLNNETGEISGVPSAAQTSTFEVRFTSLNGLNDTQAFSIVVTP